MQLVVQISCCSRKLKRSEALGLASVICLLPDPHITYFLCQTRICMAQFAPLKRLLNSVRLNGKATSQNER